MGPGFKYHIVTVSAIFFALTIGLVVGGLFVSPRVTDRQTRAIQNLQTSFNKEITAKTQQLRTYQDCLATLLPDATRGKLSGAKVALLQTGDYGDAEKAARDYLTLAGAQVCEIGIERNWNRSDTLLLPKLAELHGAEPRIPSDRTGLAEALANTLKQGDAKENGLLPILEREGLIRTVSGDDYVSGARYVVLIAGSRMDAAVAQARLAQVDAPLVAALQKQGLTLAMGEPQAVQSSDAKVYHEFAPDLPVLRDVDTDPGGSALILALRGEKPAWALAP